MRSEILEKLWNAEKIVSKLKRKIDSSDGFAWNLRDEFRQRLLLEHSDHLQQRHAVRKACE